MHKAHPTLHGYPKMTFQLAVPQSTGTAIEISLSPGQTLFLLGANGTGKSSLMHLFYTTHRAAARQVSAHRQTWFSSNAVTLSPQDKRNTETNLQHADANPQARWKDDYAAQRASIAIYDLIDAENVRSRSIAAAMDRDNIALARSLTKKDAPIKVINELLQLSNIPIEISIQESEQVLASKGGGPLYSIAELSDGERNALLVAANVLTVKPGSLILIDEPERHLHRSIISPLLTLLFGKRDDCAFVVSTHDVMLPLDNTGSQVALIRNCIYDGSMVTSWDVDLIASSADLDEEIRRDILGARNRVLFVEGTEDSLDKPIYSLIFPGVSVVPKASCRDVEIIVYSIRETSQLNWVQALGIVDNDYRNAADQASLAQKGVHALPVYSVESIYYHPELQRRIAIRQAAVTGGNPDEKLLEAREATLAAVRPHIARLSERRAEKRVREAVFAALPTRQSLKDPQLVSITIDVPELVRTEVEGLQQLVDNGNIEAIITRYPIRETGALASIACKLGLKGREQYEASIRKLLAEDSEALAFVRTLFRGLSTDLGFS